MWATCFKVANRKIMRFIAVTIMKIMLIGAEKQDFIIYPSSDKTPNYLDLIANKIAEYEK